MSSESIQTSEPARLDVEPRTIRALTETLQVLPNTGRARGADGLYLVVSGSGNEYLVDLPGGRCSCPDAQYNLEPDERCKHWRKCAIFEERVHVEELSEELDATASELEHSAQELRAKAQEIESSAKELRDAKARIAEVAGHE